MKKVGIALLWFLISATTFIIKEGDVEVGRWEEADGKNETQIIGSAKRDPKSVPKPLPAAVPVSGEAGYQWKKPELDPDQKIAEWKVSGRVLDLLRLKGIGGAEVIFESGMSTHTFKANSEGYFSGRLKQVEQDAYSIRVGKLADYEQFAHILTKGSFRTMSYQNRLKKRGAVPFNAPRISATTFDIEIGLYPLKLTPDEDNAYQAYINSIAADPKDR